MLTLLATRWHTSFLFNEAICVKHWEEDVGLSGFAFWSSISNYLVQIPQNWRTICTILRRAMAQHPNISARFLQVSAWHLSVCWLLTKAQDSTLCRILVLIYSSDLLKKMVPSWSKDPACRMNTREHQHQSCKCYSTSESTLRHMFLSNT